MSMRALQAGTLLAIRLDDRGAAEWYHDTARKIEQRLANFWTYRPEGGGHGGF